MSARPLEAPRFVRRTSLGPNEYRKNFRQIDADVLSAVTSEEADRVTPLMSKIYLRLVNAPAQYWEREGVLRFEGELSGERRITAWDELCKAVGVASATANKALRWMHEQGIVGYFAGKNGVGIRIFLNRATSSIGSRTAGKKILEFTLASSREARTSQDEAAFSDSYADLEVSDIGRNPRAPKNGAEKTEAVKKLHDRQPTCSQQPPHSAGSNSTPTLLTAFRVEVPVEEIITRLRSELEPSLKAAARQAAAQEHERTREWLENRGLPKAARVAQREAYNVLRKYGVVSEAGQASHAAVGRNDYSTAGPQPLADDEIIELAQACVAMLEVQGQSVEVTLSEMSVAAGGFLLPEDAPKVIERVESLLASGVDTHGK
jgi:DNA-binding transcriptional regulator YhcF (GntR family)